MTASLEAAFRQAGDAMVLRGRERLVDCNTAAVSLFGYEDGAALLRLNPIRLYADGQPDGRAPDVCEAADLDRALAQGACLVVRRFRRADGSSFLGEARISALDGTIFSFAVREILDHGRTERALEATQSNLRLILDSLPGRVAWIGADRRFRYVNRSYETFADRSPDEIIGKTVAEAIGDTAYGQIRSLGEAAMAGVVQHWEGWLTYSSQGERYVQRTYAPSFRDDGAIDGYFVFSLDVSEQKRAEEQLKLQREALHQSEKMSALGSLLAGVAHELNNPLAIVLAQATLLRDKTDDPIVQKRSERVYLAAERCARIVRSFLAIARQRPQKMEEVRLDHVVQGALDMTGYGLVSSGVQVTVEHRNTPTIVGDADQLVQVLMNLIVNAQHALEDMERTRQLSITTGEDGGAVVLRVADNGPGVTSEIASRIFEPFFTTKREGVGTGVGLSICHGIVTAHGGTLALEPTAGGGATFVIRLPQAQPHTAPVSLATNPSDSVLPRRSVLVVDDEPEIAETIAEIVAPLADRVDVAKNGREALSKLGACKYHLVISDLRMPDIDGPTLYARAMAEPSPFSGRFLFVTGDTLHHRLDSFLRETGLPLLEKPFEPSELRRWVTELL